MTRDQHAAPCSVFRRLRTSPASFAGAAAAVYDPALLLQLQATPHQRAVSAPTRDRGHGADVERRGSSLAIASPSPAR
jgi:hypothetical protein